MQEINNPNDNDPKLVHIEIISFFADALIQLYYNYKTNQTYKILRI